MQNHGAPEAQEGKFRDRAVTKARQCFRVLATEGEQLERFKEDRFKIEKKRVTA